jgi:hypothetical protein
MVKANPYSESVASLRKQAPRRPPIYRPWLSAKTTDEDRIRNKQLITNKYFLFILNLLVKMLLKYLFCLKLIVILI